MNNRRLLILVIIASILFLIPVVNLLFRLSVQTTVILSDSLTKSRALAVPELVEELGNFEPEDDELRYGPGENGEPHLLTPDKKQIADESLKLYKINMACSNEISLDRLIPDTRIAECKHWNYPNDLPSTSVVIIFFNEGLSVLLRTIHSIMNRTPSHLLEEILLVDDFSDVDDLKVELENYITRYPGKLRLIRNKSRQGLIRSKNRGALEATGEVIVFLDAHCEVNKNWLPPLLAPILIDSKVMTVPTIDGINYNTFKYSSSYKTGEYYYGIFEWGMLYKEVKVPDRELSRRIRQSEPYASPTHAGGLLAINRKYFLEIGMYDAGLLGWGGENFELSFKIWQCGGKILWVPCSRVGHIYKTGVPRKMEGLQVNRKGPLATSNYKRVVETWFDDKYKEYFYTREPLARNIDMGDISKQLLLKKTLQCKNFHWYLHNIAYTVLDEYPELPPNVYFGKLRSNAVNKCLDTLGKQAPATMGAYFCQDFSIYQLLRLNANGQLATGERCIEADGKEIKLTFCPLRTVDGPWIYSNETHTLRHRIRNKCLTINKRDSHLSLKSCDAANQNNHWYFEDVHPRW